MTVLEGIPYALFVMVVVFFVLFCLLVIIKLISYLLGIFTPTDKKVIDEVPDSELNTAVENGPELSCGELKLHKVDVRTAAMIMAIVSDESKIPLSELCFKSIKVKE